LKLPQKKKGKKERYTGKKKEETRIATGGTKNSQCDGTPEGQPKKATQKVVKKTPGEGGGNAQGKPLRWRKARRDAKKKKKKQAGGPGREH